MAWDLIADIGGTNARFAVLKNGVIGEPTIFDSKGALDLIGALKRVLAKHETTPDNIVIAAAGTVVDGYVDLTNANKRVDLNEVKNLCEVDDVLLINDFEAAAWALATVDDADVKTIRGNHKLQLGNRIILGAGTGLGVGTLIHFDDRFAPVPGEGGHVRISPQSDFEEHVFKAYAELWPEVKLNADHRALEAEAFLSGTGLPILYKAVSSVLGEPSDKETGKIFAHAKDKTDNAATKTIEIFAKFLGRVAGDLAVVISPHGGVFLTGGVILKNAWVLNEHFLREFDAGGRFSKMRSEMPIYLYDNNMFGLIGAANALKFKSS